ncbi:MAG TPA: 1-acyl-sn-glycerol-3-phosphate acyltransferase [Myxococcota bacterium]|nr:1-acyl-sn-glycerol-3-phosphate acyltransferase [Myxococcota bacterium]
MRTRDLLARAWRRGADPDRLDQLDPELLTALARPVLRACEAWYGLEVRGLDLVPDGPALIAGTHDSGMTFLEAIGWGAACHLARPDEVWHGLAHDGIVDLPGLGSLLVSLGTLRATPGNAAAALALGRKVVVFPGGNVEAFRPWSRRDEVDLAGRTGWVRQAVQARAPIVPVVFHGGHAGFRVLADNRWLAKLLRADRLLRVDTWPLMLALPWGLWLGPNFHLPLPVKVVTSFLPPVTTAHLDGEDDPATLRLLYDEVTTAMQARKAALAAELKGR